MKKTMQALTVAGLFAILILTGCSTLCPEGFVNEPGIAGGLHATLCLPYHIKEGVDAISRNNTNAPEEDNTGDQNESSMTSPRK